MARDVIITCAITGAADAVGKHPAIPVTPEQIATSAIEAAKAGAAVVHIHVRNPKTGGQSMELAHYREVVERIRASGVDVIINLTTGPGARFSPSDKDPNVNATPMMATPADRVRHVLELKPEICTLDLTTMNFGESAFTNIPAHLRQMAKMIYDAGVTPELEVFDTGQAMLAQQLVKEGALKTPCMMQICLGISYGAPATTEAMLMMRNLLPQPCVWAGFGISRQEFAMVAQAVILGGHTRVGLEDNLYLDQGVFAPNNAALVERAVQIINGLGERVATPAAARKILGLRGGAAKAA